MKTDVKSILHSEKFLSCVLRASTYVLCFLYLFTIELYAQQILFSEGFDDANLTSRGWYDNNRLTLSTSEHISGSTASIEFRFAKGATTPTSGGSARRKFSPSESVYLSYWVKYSANWEGSNKPYHPHEFTFITSIDGDYIGPAATHLTTYVEQNEGTPMLSIQDALNIDATRINQDLTLVTEQRGVAGCNGSSDVYPKGDCYLSGNQYRNGKSWRANRVYFTDTLGAFYKNDWHFIEAYFKLNSIVAGKGIADGIVQYWFDRKPVIDVRNMMMRTGQHPTMKFNQLLMAPYIGDGSPVEQTMWVDDLTVATGRPPQTSVSIHDEHPTSTQLIGNYPNPFSERTVIRVYVSTPRKNIPTQMSLKVFDLFGREILTLADGEFASGEYEFILEASRLPNSPGRGVFFCRLQTASKCNQQAMLVAR